MDTGNKSFRSSPGGFGIPHQEQFCSRYTLKKYPEPQAHPRSGTQRGRRAGNTSVRGSPARGKHSRFGCQWRALQSPAAADPGAGAWLEPRMTPSPVARSSSSCRGQSRVVGGRSLPVTGLRRDVPPTPARCWAASPAEDPEPFGAHLVRARGALGPAATPAPLWEDPALAPRPQPGCQPRCLAKEACEHDSVSLQKQQRKTRICCEMHLDF